MGMIPKWTPSPDPSRLRREGLAREVSSKLVFLVFVGDSSLVFCWVLWRSTKDLLISFSTFVISLFTLD